MNQLLQFIVNHWVLCFAFFMILGSLLALEFQDKLKGIPALSPQQATVLMNHEGAAVIDIRDTNAFAKGHILNAMNISQADIANRVTKLGSDKSKPIIVVDGNGQQALSVAALLQKEGFTRVYTMRNGMTSWASEHFPVVKR